MDTDITDPDGFFALSQASPGTVLDYTFTPSTDGGTTATGTLVVDPLDFGGGDTGETMTSDFAFTLVGRPVYTFADATGAYDTEDVA